MKVRRIKIGIKDWAENKRELREVFRRLGAGKKPPEDTLYFLDLATFRRCLTPKRLELLWLIGEKRPRSVRELAAIVKREPKNVNEDLRYLVSVGLVEFRRGGGRGNAKTPVVPYDRVDLSLELRGQAA
jgi:predicted transcriptional regulator